MPKIKTQDVFASINKFSGSELPACLKTILSYTAYDTAMSLEQFGEEDIISIEKYMNDHGYDVLATLNCCTCKRYKTQSHFKFLPGHKTALLAIPSKLKQLHCVKKDGGRRLLEFKKLLTNVELREMLLKKLNQNITQILTSNQMNLSFTEAHLSPIQTIISENSMMAKCDVHCLNAQCSTVTPVVYKGSWGISNVLRHLRKDSKKRQPTLDPVINTSPLADETSSGTSAVTVDGTMDNDGINLVNVDYSAGYFEYMIEEVPVTDSESETAILEAGGSVIKTG